MSFIPNALGRPKKEFFPILPTEHILMGENVYSVGYYMTSENIEVAYFKGNIVNFTRSREMTGLTGISLSYAVTEGFSGSPVLT